MAGSPEKLAFWRGSQIPLQAIGKPRTPRRGLRSQMVKQLEVTQLGNSAAGGRGGPSTPTPRADSFSCT